MIHISPKAVQYGIASPVRNLSYHKCHPGFAVCGYSHIPKRVVTVWSSHTEDRDVFVRSAFGVVPSQIHVSGFINCQLFAATWIVRI